MFSARKKRTAAIAAVLAASLVATACGGSSESDEGGKTTLSISLFGTFGYDEVGLFDAYMKQHPDIEIDYQSTQGEDKYWPALQTKLNSGSGLADIQGIEVARIAEATENQADKWSDLSDTEAARNLDLYPEWKSDAATTEDGKVIGMGTDIGPMALCYRSDLYEEAGLPSDPDELSKQIGSWDDLLALGEDYSANAPEDSAFLDSAGGLYNAIVSTESTIYYDEDGELIYDSNPAVRDAFDLAASAGESGLTAGLEQFLDASWDKGFSTGSFATIACPSWMVGYIKGKAGDDGSGKWDVMPLPGGVGGNWGGSYLAIPEVSEHQEEAADLIAWLTDAKQQAKVFSEVGNFPSNTDAMKQVADVKDEYFNDAPIGQIFSKSAQTAPTQLLGPLDGAIKNAMVQALLAVETGDVSADDAWDQAVSTVENQVG
ncbi:ABC transporter substrate-binding protein [Solicola gregarius]|uniref:Extracellular solute-binding protein n=1 Tax=Solicola gregarius TaxID=2908642 RepID=A0AA46TJV9_9ACTN|nr:extracellular solute-binding protein [Solicola gregarius]UYM05798.1 extracellular solute-binding protein [Solicola gregarius]